MSRYAANVEMQPTPLVQFDQHARNLGLCSVNADVQFLRCRLVGNRIGRNDALASLSLVAADMRSAS
jgi:hypothetical protein